ncbi:MAG: hypothetical protein ABIJ27_04475 [Candidatus Omnitrophota bacterium]
MDLNGALRSSVHRKIIHFFHDNQASVDTSRGIAAWVHEDRANVKKALEELVPLGILSAHRSTSMTGYSYTIDPKLMKKIGRLLKKNT